MYLGVGRGTSGSHRIWRGFLPRDGAAGSSRAFGQRTRFLARLRRAKGGFGTFAPRMNSSEAELDRRQTGDAQRCERESTGSPIPYAQTETGSRFKGVS